MGGKNHKGKSLASVAAMVSGWRTKVSRLRYWVICFYLYCVHNEYLIVSVTLSLRRTC